MKSTDINAIYAEKVAEFLNAGYQINTNTMNGSQGEIAKIDFRKGNEVIRVLLHSETVWGEHFRTSEAIILTVGRCTDERVINNRGFNVRRDVEHYIDSRNWYSEYQLNSKLLQMRADQFIEMCMQLYSSVPVDGELDTETMKHIEERLKTTQASNWAKESASDIFARINKEGFQNCWKDVVKSGSKLAIKVVLSLIPFGSEFQDLIDFFIQKL